MMEKEDMKTLCDLKDVTLRELRKNAEKGTMNAAEVDAVNKAVTILEKIAKIEHLHKEDEMMDKNPDSYSGAFYNIRNFPPQMPRPNMSYNSYGYDNMGGWSPEMAYSGERGRSSVTGHYVSRGSDDYGTRTMNHDTRSGHSINDRMVDQLEKMMDTASSEFERQQILDKIKMIRNSPDRMG